MGHMLGENCEASKRSKSENNASAVQKLFCALRKVRPEDLPVNCQWTPRHFYARKQLDGFSAVLVIAILSVRPSPGWNSRNNAS